MMENEGEVDKGVGVDMDNEVEAEKINNVTEYNKEETNDYSENMEEHNESGMKQVEEEDTLDKNQEIGDRDHHTDGEIIAAAPVEEIIISKEVNNSVEESPKLYMIILNGDQQKDDNGKGVHHVNVGENCLENIDHSQDELLPSSPIESEIQSHGQLMVFVDGNGVGLYPPIREEITQGANISREEKDEI
ncbi:hypothetical protein K7X08_014976 [Anisodus acutangulus]|uniref:Uncharacterized protein n=1 Tax=Anisodus acutangulus TaxID=402998 RepID=A0A9Q1L3A8_9SOLA|nr:hypothetical protein K7X08_014976 [Anisodus acutangulus]